jgi:hypothetical protein
MIGPFDSLTSSGSGERAEAGAVVAEAAAGWEACSAGCSFEHPARIVPADATRAAYPNFLRLRVAGDAVLAGAGEQVPHPVEWQPPHPLPAVLTTLSSSPIVSLPFESALFAPHNYRATVVRVIGELGTTRVCICAGVSVTYTETSQTATRAENCQYYQTFSHGS